MEDIVIVTTRECAFSYEKASIKHETQTPQGIPIGTKAKSRQ